MANILISNKVNQKVTILSSDGDSVDIPPLAREVVIPSKFAWNLPATIAVLDNNYNTSPVTPQYNDPDTDLTATTPVIGGFRPPTDLDGLDRQIYIDFANRVIYPPKKDGKWGQGTNLDGKGYDATSPSNITVSPGAKTLLTRDNLAYKANVSRIRVAKADNPNIYMEGLVTFYDGYTLQFTCDFYKGSGNYSNWVLSITGDTATATSEAALYALQAQASAQAAALAQSAGLVGFTSRSGLYGNLNYGDKTVAIVNGDSTPEYNTLYFKSGASGFGFWASQGIMLIPVYMYPESGYVWALTDMVTKRSPVRLTTEGVFEIDYINLPAGAVTTNSLDATLKGLIPVTLNPESGYVWALTDPVTKRSPVRVTVDGVFEADLISLPFIQINYSNFDASTKIRLIKSDKDFIEDYPDNDFRALKSDINVRTSASGSNWERFPPRKVNFIRGKNKSGVDIQVRKSSKLSFFGKRYRTTYQSSQNAITKLGTFKNNTTYPPASTPANGSYYLYDDVTTRIISGNIVEIGDMIVYNGGWSVVKAPRNPALDATTAGFRNHARGDWWIISADCYIDGVQYLAGERIVFVGYNANASLGALTWKKGIISDILKDNGELYYKGEFSAAAGNLPVSSNNGEVFQVSEGGTIAGYGAVVIGDYFIREDNEWIYVPTDKITSVASAKSIYLPVIRTAAEYEVRRVDKSETRAGVSLLTRTLSSPKSFKNALALISDSMFGAGSIGTQTINLAERSLLGSYVNSMGSAQSHEILSQLEYEILNNGDRYADYTYGFWHGTNNPPSAADGSDLNSVQIKECAMLMDELVASIDKRAFHLTVPGKYNCIWDGSRITVPDFEGQFTKTNSLYALERWYANTFKNRWVSPYKAMLNAATSDPHPLFPTNALVADSPLRSEIYVAQNYGVLPIRFSADLPVAANTLVFKGVRSTTGLPTGGSPGDYFIRSVTTIPNVEIVGNLLINVNNTWQEINFDRTHFNTVAGAIIAAANVALLNANNW